MSMFTRREMLRRSAQGFGWLAASSLLAEESRGNPASGSVVLHHPAKAKNVIFLFMDGGPSQVDTFDPKPRLDKENGQPFRMKIEATQFDQNGSVMASPFTFNRHGRSGIEMSELFPHLARCADDLCIIRSMKAEFPEHSQGCLYMHSGHPIAGRPSLGAWASYGLGTENQSLPGFVVLNGGMIPLGGVLNYASAFLPATHQGSYFDLYSGGEAIANITPADASIRQKEKLALVAAADRELAANLGPQAGAIEAAIRNGETAFAMQSEVPGVVDLAGESKATRELYGVDSKNEFTAQYARQCLIARRLVERGVRFIELTCVKGLRNVSPWDDHANIKIGHARNAQTVDQPIAALLQDLKSRGLLDSTLVIFAGEFGRTPFAQGSRGRDHNPQGFSIWMAGGGVKGGTTYGATDEYGYHAIDKIVSVHDLHATILHLLGLNHEKLTYRWSGRDFRLTDVHGHVVHEILT